MAIDIDSLQIQIEATSSDAEKNIDSLTNSLTSLKAVAKGGAGLNTISKQLQALVSATNGATSAGNKISNLANALKALQNIQRPSGMSSAINSLNKIKEIDLSNASTEKIQNLVTALNSLSSVQKATGLNSTINALKKLPEITEQLEKTDLNAFASQIQRVASALRPLSSEMAQVSAGFSAFPTRIQRLISQNDRLYSSNQRTANSFGLYAKMGVYYYALRRAAGIMSEWVNSSTGYVENLNLFTVAMGDGAQAALEYAEEVQEALGIDMSEFIRNQGVFKQITSGFGVIEEKANLMSKNLTQIGYDISSYFNIGIEESMEKVQSGIAGELEPLRRLGYALDVATLQEIAYKHGIDMRVNSMTQAQKSQLRYLAIMEQSENVMGDMARTVLTPANSMRILGQQINQLTRALGNLLIPFLIKVIPYIQAFVEILTEAIQRLAVLAGFEIPKIDYSGLDGIASGSENAEDALNGTTSAAKKLRDAVLGIDELNIISPYQDSVNGGSGMGVGGDLPLDLPEYDFLKNFRQQTDDIKRQMEEVLDVVLAIGAGLLAWKITSNLINTVGTLKNTLGGIQNLKLAAGVTLMVTGFTLSAMGSYGLGRGDYSTENILKTILGSALGIAGSLLVFGTGPLGWTIGISAALIVNIASFALGSWDQSVEDDLKSRFGEIVLSDDQISEWAQALTTSDLAIKLGVYVDEKETLSSLKEQVEKSISELNKQNFRASIGLEIDQASYQEAVDTFIANAQEYIQQQQIVSSMSVDILLGGTETGDRLSGFATDYYGDLSKTLSEKTSELKDTVAAAFADGEWFPDKFQEAVDLQKEIQEILDYVSNVEFEAKLEGLRLDAKGTDLTVESFQSVMDEAQETIQTQMEDLKGVRLESLKIAKMEYDQNVLNGMSKEAAQDIYDSAVEAADKAFQDKSITLNSATFEFGINTLTDAFSEELKSAEPVFSTTIRDAFEGGFIDGVKNPEELYQAPIEELMLGLQEAYRIGFENVDISAQAKENLKSLIEVLKPTKEQLKEIQDQAFKTGEAVPEYVNQGLTSIAKLEAITGSVEAQNYLIGQMLSTDPSFKELLKTSEGAGESINKDVAAGLLSSVSVVREASTGTVNEVKNTITGETEKITPTLRDNFYSLGQSLGAGLYSGTFSTITDITNYDWKGLFGKVTDYAIEEFDTHSPSKVFTTLGEYNMQGLYNGMDGWEEDFTQIFKNIVNAGITQFNTFIQWINEKMKISWDAFEIAGKEIIPAGSIQLIKIPTIPLLASGGFVDQGQMFIAREQGPELVGKIGKRTAVANNQQIEEGIYRASLEANEEQNALLRRQNELLMAILEKSGGNVYLDGKQILKSSEKAGRERGAVIMSGGVVG